ncbi:hypothetical protein BDV06DRAFT_199311 [Aspergillus oleicola]
MQLLSIPTRHMPFHPHLRNKLIKNGIHMPHHRIVNSPLHCIKMEGRTLSATLRIISIGACTSWSPRKNLTVSNLTSPSRDPQSCVRRTYSYIAASSPCTISSGNIFSSSLFRRCSVDNPLVCGSLRFELLVQSSDLVLQAPCDQHLGRRSFLAQQSSSASDGRQETARNQDSPLFGGRAGK